MKKRDVLRIGGHKEKQRVRVERGVFTTMKELKHRAIPE